MSGARQPALPGSPSAPEGREAGWEFERLAWEDGRVAVAGVDEVGRGALAGPVVVAAVIFPPGSEMEGLRDSKLLSPRRRELLAGTIRERAAGIVLERIEADVVDRVNILEATLLGASRAVSRIRPRPDLVLLDALRLPGCSVPQRRLVRGDRLSASVAAASILAKVERDRLMVEFDRSYPYYGFGRHKGYGTREHLEALRRRGPSPIHRRTFLRSPSGTGNSTLF